MKSGRKPPRFPLTGEEEAHPLETVALCAARRRSSRVGAALWVTGEVSGRLFGGAWPTIASAEMGRVLARFPRHAARSAQSMAGCRRDG